MRGIQLLTAVANAAWDPHAIYPKQVPIDVFGSDPRPRGMRAFYDKSVAIDDIKAAIDEFYGKWALANNDKLPVKLVAR